MNSVAMKRLAWIGMAGILMLSIAACTRAANAPGSSATVGPGGTTVTASTASTAPSTGTLSSSNEKTTAGPVTSVVNTVRPSVVKVDASGTTTSQGSGPFGGAFQGGPPTQAAGTGTGILLDSQGHILTNNHVVTLESPSPASSIKVTLANGKTVSAKLVGQDPQTDLAVIQVSASDVSGLKPVQWANNDSIVVGEPVVAIGYALDLGGEPTVTTGVVSATNRAISEQTTEISGAVQTDAAINPGNSGGPLLDMNSQVIGINTAGLAGTPSQPVQGVNFAISVATAKPVADTLISKGSVTRGYLGVGVISVTSELQQANSLPVDHGAGIGPVTSGSPAAQAGLQSGDIIVKLGSVAINSTGDLTTALTQYGPGSKQQITFYRGKNQMTASITIGSRPSTG